MLYFLRYKTPSLLVIAVLVVILSTCGTRQPTSQPYLVLYAFSDEGQLLREKMSVEAVKTHLGRDVYTGTLASQKIVLAEAGIGMTNAAMTTQRMIDSYHPAAVILTGIAGGIDTSVHIGDITACHLWIEHDYGYLGADGFELGQITAYEPRTDTLQRISAFPVDSALWLVADRLRKTNLELKPVGSRQPALLVGGVGVSGNLFVDSEEKRLWLSDKFGAMVTDMETAAVAQVCHVNNLPFIAFRSASDLAGGSGSKTARAELDQFFKIAADNSSQVVVKFLGEL